MKVVNESTGFMAISFTYHNGATGCGYIPAGGDPVEKTGVAKVQITIGAGNTMVEPIEYSDLPENAVVRVMSAIDGD